MTRSHTRATLTAIACAACCWGPSPAWSSAHGVSGKDAVFLQGLQGRAIVPLMYLGAKHMVTGYDHLLFLVGVIFFLYRLKDVAALRQPVHDRPQRDAARSACSAASTPTRI